VSEDGAVALIGRRPSRYVTVRTFALTIAAMVVSFVGLVGAVWNLEVGQADHNRARDHQLCVIVSEFPTGPLTPQLNHALGCARFTIPNQ
jgi:hypothetical protein